MKKEKLSTFFRGKGFYTALAAGAAALFAVGMISTNLISDKKKEIAENPSTQIAENAQQGEDTMENSVNESTPTQQENTITKPETNGDAKQEETEEQKEEISDLVEPKPDVQVEEQVSQEPEIEVSEVLSSESQIDTLTFAEEEELVWPVQGEILLDYSMEKPIYFKTLAQYKCNSAIAIEAKENTEVYSAAKGIVMDISESDETGVTLTASIGSDYQLVYGQLGDVRVKVGDTIEKGEVLAVVAAPTKYYTEEGSHLYFKVLHGEEPVNPLLLLN